MGSFPRLRDKLNKDAIDGAVSSANVLSIQAEMASGPDAEWGLILRKSKITSCDVKVGREGRKDARGHVGRMDDPGIKAGCKKKGLNIMALSGSEVDEAEPFDSVMEWLVLE